MTIKRDSPLRRNSFAVANKSQAHPGRKRRAHSIAPGDPLSPAAKARRSLAPRKSILKGVISGLEDGDDATQSMDITRDYREDIPSRKSLGRRVSFANHAHVRLFEVPDRNTNSTASPQSSPADPDSDVPRPMNDENAYPGAPQRFRRRSSARHSLAFNEDGGEQSMDMDSDDTGFSPSAFFRNGNEDISDEGFNDVDGPSDGDDMDVTEVIPRNIVRKNSLSFGVSRQPLANLFIPQSSATICDDQQDDTNDASYIEEESTQSQSFSSEGNVSQPMEFTVPLIRPPEPPSEAWLALCSATHSGNTPYIPSSDDEGEGDGNDVQEMELTDAVSRLQAARTSLGLGEVGEGGDGSFTSTEDSFMDEDAEIGEDGNQTVNVTQLMKRASIGQSADSTLTSVISSQEQSKEDAIKRLVSGSSLLDPLPVYPSIPESPPPAVISTEGQVFYPAIPSDDPVPAAVALDIPTISNVPLPMVPEEQPVPSEESPQSTVVPDPPVFTFTPKSRTPMSTTRSRSSSPAKIPSSPKRFTAAFAPPVTRLSPQKRASGTSSARHVTQLSPVKQLHGTERLSITPGRGTGAVRVLLSPSNTSPLKLAVQERAGAGLSKRNSIGFRRPSGYFAQRRSLGNLSTDTAGNTLSGQKNLESNASYNDSIDNGIGPKSTPTGLSGAQRQGLPSEHLTLNDNLSIRTSRDLIPDDRITRPEPNEVEQEGEVDSEGPRITIERFFEMTGIRFMDDIAAPRRSMVHPSVLRPSRRASTEAQIPLAEFAIAMAINVPQLELYNHVSKDLQTWVERIKDIHREAEEEAQKVTPPLFQEFVATDENGQAELLHQLKLIKVYNHAQAKSEWYDWKAQWIEQLYQKANEGFKRLEGDAKELEKIIRQAQEIVPSLQREYDELMEELEKEKAEVTDLEGCDQNYLNELKGTIAEQSAELDTYHADVEEAKAKLDRLEEKLGEVESQKKEVMVVVEDAERRIHMQKNSTRAEVFQLKDELEALQSLHAWRITKVLPELFEFAYASNYRVSVPCINFHPVTAEVQITRVGDPKTNQEIPDLSALMLKTAKQLVARRKDQSIRQIVQCLGDYWSSCSQLQVQLKLVSIKFPLSIEEMPNGFSATATILFPSLKAKALISFIFDTRIMTSWPVLSNSVRCDARVVYGRIDGDVLQRAVAKRIGQASPVNNHAYLLDACMEATECFT